MEKITLNEVSQQLEKEWHAFLDQQFAGKQSSGKFEGLTSEWFKDSLPPKLTTVEAQIFRNNKTEIKDVYTDKRGLWYDAETRENLTNIVTSWRYIKR